MLLEKIRGMLVQFLERCWIPGLHVKLDSN